MVLLLPSIDSLQLCHPECHTQDSISPRFQHFGSTEAALCSVSRALLFRIHRNNSDDSASFPGWIRLTPARQSKGATRSNEDEVSLSPFRATNFDAALPS